MKQLREVVVGDTVYRWFAGMSKPMILTVSAVTPDRIFCSDREFDRETGGEIDEFLGWGPTKSGSFITVTPVNPTIHAENN